MYVQGEVQDWAIVTNENQHGWPGAALPSRVSRTGMTIAEAIANYTMFVMAFVASLLPRPAPGSCSVNRGAGLGRRSPTRGATPAEYRQHGQLFPVPRGNRSAPPVAGLILVEDSEAQGD